LGTPSTRPANQIGVLAAFNAASGFSLTNARTLGVTGADVSNLGITGINSGTGDVTMLTTAGDLNLLSGARIVAGTVSGSQIVMLDSAGNFTQSDGSTITGGTVTLNAATAPGSAPAGNIIIGIPDSVANRSITGSAVNLNAKDNIFIGNGT